MPHVLRSPAFAGYRIAVIGDLHIAPWSSTRVVAHSVDLINDWEPDLIALVGDFGVSIRALKALSRGVYRAAMPRVNTQLARLRARDGVFAVLGNHDVDGNASAVVQTLGEAGITVLRNEAREVTRDRGLLRVFGADEIPPQAAQLDALFTPAPDAIIVIAHHPDFVSRCSGRTWPAPSVVLAGHTHGGQIVFPRLGAPVTASRVARRSFPCGFVPNDSTALYVTRGLGEQIPVRINAPHEITLLELAER